MSEILKHELMPVPIAIAETNGSLKSGNKSLLLEILLKNGDTNDLIYFNDRAALIIDGQFVLRSLSDEFCCQKEGQVFFIFRQRKKTWQIRR
jgi:hypothetical protein